MKRKKVTVTFNLSKESLEHLEQKAEEISKERGSPTSLSAVLRELLMQDKKRKAA